MVLDVGSISLNWSLANNKEQTTPLRFLWPHSHSQQAAINKSRYTLCRQPPLCGIILPIRR